MVSSSSSMLIKISDWASDLGFSEISVANIETSEKLNDPIKKYTKWIKSGFHGEMTYLKESIPIRRSPDRLLRGVKRAIMVSMNYLPQNSSIDWREKEINGLKQSKKATVSIFARGKDYHRIMRKRLSKLAKKISKEVGPYGFRACVDSAPILEVELAQESGLGWRGKNTLLLKKNQGSFFFLGTLLTDLPLKVSQGKEKNLCGTCNACLEKCPTKAFVGPYLLDARKCISYLTIENRGIIDLSMRHLIGNRIYGCDDCQLVCPWNKYAKLSPLSEFDVKNELDNRSLLDLFEWDENQFLSNHSGSAILRISYEMWLRNIAVALGNAGTALKKNKVQNDGSISKIKETLLTRINEDKPILKSHLVWALKQCQ
tara:strand:- start:56 stop:1171 length:1116 start_codon:yes stop_codon:yes gene_type:complete